MAAVAVVMPGGWTAFAVDEDAPPSGEINEVYTPDDAADDGVGVVGSAPTEGWVLEPAPDAPQSRSVPGVPEGLSPEPAETYEPAETTEPSETAATTPAPAEDAAATEPEPESSDADSEDAAAEAVDEEGTPAEAEAEALAEAEAPAAAEEKAESAEPGSGSAVVEGVEPPTSNAAPVGTPVGAPGLGALPWFSFDEIPLTTNSVARVNLGNGNLLVTGNDATLNSAAIPLRNDRFYNGLSSSSGAFGDGWSSALSATDVGLQISGTNGNTATYRGPNGYTAVFTNSSGGWVAPAGFKATLTNETYGKKLTFNESGEQIRFNTSGWIINYFDRNGIGLTYGYTNGKLSTVTEASGRSFTIGYQTSGDTNKIRSITDSSGRTTLYTIYQGRLARVDAPGDVFENYSWNANGTFRGIAWYYNAQDVGQITFSYDNQARITKIERGTIAGGSNNQWVSTQSYSYQSGYTLVTDGNGNTTRYNLDSGGKVTSVLDALGNTRSQTWNANNSVTSTTDAIASGTNGTSTLYTYDSLGNSTGATLPTGAAASATYALGNGCTNTGGNQFQVKCSTDPSGNKKRYDYDSAGNTTKVSDTTAGGTGAATQQYTYASSTSSTACNNAPALKGQVCSSKDGNNNTTLYKYDTSGNLLLVDAPAPMGDTNYVYDSLGRVTKVTDGNGDVTQYTYNVRDDVLNTTFDDGKIMRASYYQNGLKERESESADNTGPFEQYVYDPLGRITSVTQKVANGNPGQTVSTYVYSYTYDGAGNTTAIEDTRHGKVTYGYDAANQLTRIADPGKTCPTAAGSPAGSGCVKIGYNANGVETSRTFPGNATVTTTVDAAGRPTRITAKDTGNTVRVDTGYSYTAPGQTGSTADRGNIQTRTAFTEVGVTAGAVTTYGYDSLGRLTSALEKVGTVTNASWAYAYDAAGNRTQQIRSGATGAVAGTISYGYNAANQLTSATGSSTTWTYDAAGNQTRKGLGGQTATYNGRGAVTAIGTNTYTAWAQGNSRTLTRTAGSTGFVSSYLNSPTGLMSGSFEDSVRAYTRTPDGEIVGARYSSSRYYFSQDHLGSTTGMFDQTGTWIGGYSYSPYGEARGTTNTTVINVNAIRYIGGYLDTDAGLYRLGARYYDPSMARFTQVDPSGQEANQYSYATGNPINKSDPSGLLSGAGALGLVVDFYGFVDLAVAIGSGDSRQIAIEIVKIGVGTLTQIACTGIAAGAFAGPAGIALAAVGCILIAEFVSNATVGFN